MYYVPRKGRGQWKNGPKWVKERCAGAREKDMSLKPGQEISGVFGPNDPPPWYDLDAPRYPRARTDEENLKETNRRKKAREKFLEKKQLTDPLATLTPQEEEQFQTSDPTKYPKIPGYIGSPKGAKQMLWERGHWQSGLTVACCRKILKGLPDFQLETSELSNLWRNRGHGFELGVKCHPEMAGCGIEYCWGKVCVCVRALVGSVLCTRACTRMCSLVCVCTCSHRVSSVCVRVCVCVCVCYMQGKYEFRNFINTKTTKVDKQVASVLTALGRVDFEVRYSKKRRAAPLPLFRTRRYARTTTQHTLTNTHSPPPPIPTRRYDRKCRDYKRAYLKFSTPRALHRASQTDNDSGYKVIKKIIEKVKAHRCTGALQSKVCKDEEVPSWWLKQLRL